MAGYSSNTQGLSGGKGYAQSRMGSYGGEIEPSRSNPEGLSMRERGGAAREVATDAMQGKPPMGEAFGKIRKYFGDRLSALKNMNKSHPSASNTVQENADPLVKDAVNSSIVDGSDTSLEDSVKTIGGGIAGTTIGTAVGGPLGGAIGGAVGESFATEGGQNFDNLIPAVLLGRVSNPESPGDNIKPLQAMLKKEGLLGEDGVDGNWGPKSIEAMRTWMTNNPGGNRGNPLQGAMQNQNSGGGGSTTHQRQYE